MWDYPVGWACVAIERSTAFRKVFYGAMNDGTVNVAELMAYLAPLSWYMSTECKKEKHGRLTGVRHVHIITDSEYAQQKGDAKAAVTMTHNTMLWAAFALFERHGLCLHWHWQARETIALNCYVDALSKAARQLVKDTKTLQHVKDNTGLTPRDCNPE